MNDIPMTLAQQTFDGLGRQRTVDVAGRLTHYHYQAGQLPPSANTLADGKRVAFTYEPHLDNALLSTTADGEAPQRLSYHASLGIPITASGALGSQHWHFTASGMHERDTWAVDDVEHLTTWRHSLNGLPLSFTDADGVEHRRHYDAQGRVEHIQVGTVTTRLSYDAFSRLACITSTDSDSGRQLVKQLSYDTMGREHSSRFSITSADETRTITQTLAYSNLDQLVSRSWHDGEQHGEEHFEYDLRSRLSHYRANPDAATLDPFGNRIVAQRFTFNALNGYQSVISTFADGSQDQATFTYSPTDPTQVVAISHSHDSWPALITLTYDACGRVIADSLGRRLRWNAQDRLISVEYNDSSCDYHYDPSGRLCDRVVDGKLARSFFSGGQMTHEHQGQQRLGLVSDGQTLFALNKLADGVRQTTLLGCDTQGSVRLAVDAQLHTRRYSPHGAEQHRDEAVPFGFTGTRREPLTGWYIPAGYRPYDPLLMSFLSPDSESPFGRGGINPYAYCAGDPINRVDPDGHSWVNWAVTGVGLAIGAAVAIATLGTALPAIATVYAGGVGALTASNAIAIGSAALNAISLGTGIASVALQANGTNEKAASVLGWVSLGSGIASAVLGMTPGAAKLAARLVNSPGRASAKAAAFKPYRLGNADVIFAKTSGASDVTFIHNLYGEGNAALLTHGHPLGMLMNAQGQADDAVNIARNLIAPRLAEMGYPAQQKIVLLTCWGGKSGAAQQIANELRRPVEAYSKKLYVTGAASLQLPRHQGARALGSMTNVPLYRISPLKWLTHGQSPATFLDDATLRVAKSKLYYPH